MLGVQKDETDLNPIDRQAPHYIASDAPLFGGPNVLVELLSTANNSRTIRIPLPVAAVNSSLAEGTVTLDRCVIIKSSWLLCVTIKLIISICSACCLQSIILLAFWD